MQGRGRAFRMHGFRLFFPTYFYCAPGEGNYPQNRGGFLVYLPGRKAAANRFTVLRCIRLCWDGEAARWLGLQLEENRGDRLPMMEFHIAGSARQRYQFAKTLFSYTGNVIFANVAACREFAYRMNQVRDAQSLSRADGSCRCALPRWG